MIRRFYLQICWTDVTTCLTTILVVDRINVNPGVGHTSTNSGYSIYKTAQCDIGRGDPIVGGTTVVLYLLEEDDVGVAQLLNDLRGNQRLARVIRRVVVNLLVEFSVSCHFLHIT
jgi:hypothetical protein